MLRKLLVRGSISNQVAARVPAGFINCRGDSRGEGAVMLNGGEALADGIARAEQATASSSQQGGNRITVASG